MQNNSQVFNPVENAHEVSTRGAYLYEFSICTLVTKKEEYGEMVTSFVNYGFAYDSCEYLYIDNSQGCQHDAFSGLNIFLQKAQGKYIILCHQDILLYDHNKDDLKRCIAQMNRIDPNWAILGNAGGINLKWRALHITEKCGKIHKEKLLPLKVMNVDENFILVKNGANLALSRDLNGFHMYGTDICLIADILGYNAYVVDFNLIHKSNGNADKSFYVLKDALIQKYHRAFRVRFMLTTITRFCISGNWWDACFCNSKPILFLARQYYKFFTRKEQYYKI